MTSIIWRRGHRNIFIKHSSQSPTVLSCIVNIVHPHLWVDYTINIHHITLQSSTCHWSPAGHHQGAGAEDGLAHCHCPLHEEPGWGLSIKLVVGECAGGGCARTEAAQPWAGTRAPYNYSFGVQWGQYTLHTPHTALVLSSAARWR